MFTSFYRILYNLLNNKNKLESNYDRANPAFLDMLSIVQQPNLNEKNAPQLIGIWSIFPHFPQ
jgi:hypothetical protein